MARHSQLTSKTIDDILAIYAEQAVAHRTAISNGDSDAASGAYDRVLCCSKELKKRGAGAQRTLLSLLNHSDADVRYCAAIDALQFAPEMGKAALVKLAESTNVCGARARLILQRWKRGALKLPE